VSIEYWSLAALLATEAGESLLATLVQIGDRKVPTKIDRETAMDAGRGAAARSNLGVLTGQEAEALREALQGASFTIEDIRTKEQRRTPPAPFITSTFQQEASRKLGLSARRAMGVAQRLYEGGYITYMRTDSTSMAA